MRTDRYDHTSSCGLCNKQLVCPAIEDNNIFIIIQSMKLVICKKRKEKNYSHMLLAFLLVHSQ